MKVTTREIDDRIVDALNTGATTLEQINAVVDVGGARRVESRLRAMRKEGRVRYGGTVVGWRVVDQRPGAAASARTTGRA